MQNRKVPSGKYPARGGLIILSVLFMLVCLSGTALFGLGNSEESSCLKVVTSTSLIEQIVTRIGADKIEVTNIIPPAQCPGHFDVKPGDIQKLADADIFFLHGWQGETFTDQLVASVNNPNLSVLSLNIKGNWMVPAVQQKAVEEIKTALMKADQENSSYYEQRANEYLELIKAKETEIQTRLTSLNLNSVRILCAQMQQGFIDWTGFSVVATYGQQDSLTPQDIKKLIDLGKTENVGLIIDNLQSGENTGKGMAEELQCPRIILTNFPGGIDNTESWEKTIDYNIQLILDILES